MSHITAIEQQQRDKTRCSVYIDGAFYCGLKIEVAVKYRLKPGMEIEKSALDEIQLANEKLQAGTLFTKSISETSDELVNTCLKKLALQAAGISEESQSAAESIIANLKTLSSANN